VESGGFLDLLYGRNSGQHEEWIWTADLLVQCQEASSVESYRLKPGELLIFRTSKGSNLRTICLGRWSATLTRFNRKAGPTFLEKKYRFPWIGEKMQNEAAA
jgi:hypothetical protein